ncbi:probable G-protein coupled receptor 158 [Oppia nitens]|uniref:probable G-protein coupled receptor 158 n=1 Tax=Oppia nitens TaxID=1686743 RepID=UPI0023DAD82F|nr:probable G-protein coupled receptor 158 [Oppia nitens]
MIVTPIHHLIYLILLITIINLTHRSLSSSTYERGVEWGVIGSQKDWIVLDLLQKYHNASAILHFIELTHNISNINANTCVRQSLLSLNFSVKSSSYQKFSHQSESALKTANLLTNLFTVNESLPPLVLHKEFFESIVRANVQTDPYMFGSGIAFSANSFANNNDWHFAPYAYRNVTNKQIVLSDLTRSWSSVANHYNMQTFRTDNYSLSGDWFWAFATNHYGQHLHEWHNNPNNGLLMKSESGIWTTLYYDCRVTNTWLITHIVPFFGSSLTDTTKRDLKGVVVVSIDLLKTDINQCAGDDSFFSDTHKCHIHTTQCHPIKGIGFHRGAYICQCKDGYYMPNRNISNLDNSPGTNYFRGITLEEAFVNTLTGSQDTNGLDPHNFICIPCESGCEDCINDSPCFVHFNLFIRTITLGIQSFCATITFMIGIAICKLRRYKTIATSRWVVLEMILFGAFMLYITVIIRYYESTPLTCFLEPWFREVGFAFCYGAIVIKVYRIYAEFQTRKAHRVCVRDKDLLKYLGGIVLVVTGYMSAWTALVLDGIDDISQINWFDGAINLNVKGRNILEEKTTSDGLRYIVCRQLSWDYVTEMGELIFLLTGVYITYCIRNARKEIYKEKWTLALSIYLETIVSFTTYTVKHLLWFYRDLHPDHIFLLYMIRCQLTVTPMLIMIFLPKFWFHSRTRRADRHRSRHLSAAEAHDPVPEAMKLHSAILSNGEIDIGDINLADMDPEDIRSELRRVYTQLQVLRNKTMRKDNPHISKRRGGRKTHRRFSLQPFHHKHKQHEQEMTEISRTPEESTASLEGTGSCQPDGPSTVRIDPESSNITKLSHINRNH